VYSWNREQVPVRSESQRIHAKGFYPGATVVKVPDSADEYKEQDGKNMFSVDETSSVALL